MKYLVLTLLLFIPCISFTQEVENSYISKENQTTLESLIYDDDFERAIQFLNDLIKSDSLNPYLYTYLGTISIRKSGISYFKRAIQIDSNYIHAHWQLGVYYVELVYGQNYLNKIEYLDNDSSYMNFNEDYLDSAIYHCEKVLEIDSSWLYSVRSFLYDLYLSKGKSSKAIIIKECNYQPPIETDSLNVPLNSNVYYFPLENLIDTINIYYGHTVVDGGFYYRRRDFAHYKNSWYSSYLYAFKEPLLNNDYYNHDVYRFTWLRSFNEPIVIRIENNKSSIQLFSKMTNGMGGYTTGELIISDSLILNDIQWSEFTNKINKIDFWNVSPIENTHGAMGEDGAHWILEGIKDGHYHMIDRWSGKDKETGGPCLYLLKLSGLEVVRIY